MKTRTHYLRQMDEAIAENYPQGVANALAGLIFLNARLDEPRGISDTRLTDDKLREILDVLPEGSVRDMVVNYLLREEW